MSSAISRLASRSRSNTLPSDSDISDFAPTYYGANLAQLQMVKHTYDPDRFFSFAQAIPK